MHTPLLWMGGCPQGNSQRRRSVSGAGGGPPSLEIQVLLAGGSPPPWGRFEADSAEKQDSGVEISDSAVSVSAVSGGAVSGEEVIVTAQGKGAARRQQIMDAAVELFGEVGYRGTSLRELAERVGITHPGLLYHFTSKEKLLSAVLARRDDRNDDSFALLVQPTAREHLARVLELAEHNSTVPGMIELFTTLSAESTDRRHPAHAYFVERYDRIVGINQQIFDDLAVDGDLKSDIDPAGLGQAFTALMDGLQVQWLYRRDAVDVPSILRGFLNNHLRKPL